MSILKKLSFAWIGLFLILLCRFSSSATPQTMIIACGGEKKQEQKGLIRAKRDSGTWPFNLVAIGNAKLRDVTWTYSVTTGATTGWGTITERVTQPEKSFQATWTSPPIDGVAKTGKLKVTAKGKRVCPGGPNNANGTGVEDTFEVSWETDVFGVKILKGGNDITDKSSDIIVGESIDLTGEIEGLPAGKTPTSKKWTLPGDTIKNYRQAILHAEVIPLTTADLETENLTFFFNNGSFTGKSVEVTYTVVVEDVSSTAKTTFKAFRPRMDSFTAAYTTNTPLVNVDDPGSGEVELHFGSATSPGISWNASVTVPNAKGGEIAFLQLINPSRSRKGRPGIKRDMSASSNGDFVLDENDGVTIQYKSGNATQTLSATDTPGYPMADGYATATVNDSFETYLTRLATYARFTVEFKILKINTPLWGENSPKTASKRDFEENKIRFFANFE